MIDDKVIDELREETKRCFSAARSDPEYQQVLAETRAECSRIREEVKARRLERARKAAACRWEGHVAVDWMTVHIPRSVADELRHLCPGLSVSKAIQHLCELHRGAVSP